MWFIIFVKKTWEYFQEYNFKKLLFKASKSVHLSSTVDLRRLSNSIVNPMDWVCLNEQWKSQRIEQMFCFCVGLLKVHTHDPTGYGTYSL